MELYEGSVFARRGRKTITELSKMMPEGEVFVTTSTDTTTTVVLERRRARRNNFCIANYEDFYHGTRTILRW